MFCEEARLKKNILSSVSVRCTAGFSLLSFWQESNSVLLLGALVVLVIVFFIWLIFRRRPHDVFPEIKLEAKSPTLEKDMTMIESEPEKAVRPASFPGIYGKIEVLVGDQQINTYLVTDNPLSIGRDPAHHPGSDCVQASLFHFLPRRPDFHQGP
jgi:hypothetical protein